MGIKRVVDTSFWTDGKVDEFTPEDKYFMLYLLTNPFSTQLGIYEISIKQVAFHLGYSMDSVRNLIDRFENKYGIIIFSKSTNEIAIKNFLRHSIMKGGKPVEDCIKREMAKVKNKSLISKVFNHISDKDDLNDTVRKIIGEFQNENHNDNEIHNDNDNDNDNDVSSPVRSTNRPAYAQRIVNESSKQSYGKFKNVLLTDDELQKLKATYSDWEERIERLSAYMQGKKKTYEDHYATIELWAMNDKKNQEQQRRSEAQSSGNPFLNAAKESMFFQE